jgi:hypothetical protein
VTADEASAAVARIAARRRTIDDQSAWRMGEDPHDVLVYLRRYSGGVPREVAEADVLDGLVLKLRLWWLAEEAEWWLLERGRALGVAPGRIGQILGIGTRQGVYDRRRHAGHKAALLAQEPSREPAVPAEQQLHDVQARWLSRHRAAVQDLARRALAFRDLAGDEVAEWLVDVARDLADDAMTPGVLHTLHFALAELQVDDTTAQAGRTPDRDELLSRWSALYSSYPSTVGSAPLREG